MCRVKFVPSSLDPFLEHGNLHTSTLFFYAPEGFRKTQPQQQYVHISMFVKLCSQTSKHYPKHVMIQATDYRVRGLVHDYSLTANMASSAQSTAQEHPLVLHSGHAFFWSAPAT